MKIKTTLLAAAALSISGMAAAEVTITVPDTVDVLVANDAKPELSGGFFSSKQTLTLPDGENQILFRYQPYFTQGKDRIILESDPIIATFDTKNTELTFDMPKYRDQREAEKEIKQVDWQLITASGSALAVKQDKLVKDGMQIGRNFKIELADYNRRGGVAAVSAATIGAAVQPVTLPAQVTQEGIKSDSTAEEMLHFWYNKADAATQARFKQFLLEK
ncbi:DUF2057 family protein [Vibrio neptunius]|uniref:DUF2057 family protein n=1 Tax=Vibrio neptunius TaxID=170651 RepID=UPI0019D07FF1|nr:DUF2057 family protein [Vibrio neptunius]MBN3574054.1 DUF2057 family protein [Vibrio neptunius]QXX09282.1 DUF2057 family protein [Vibrio neptunius]